MKVTMATRKPNFSTEEVEVLVNAVVPPLPLTQSNSQSLVTADGPKNKLGVQIRGTMKGDAKTWDPNEDCMAVPKRMEEKQVEMEVKISGESSVMKDSCVPEKNTQGTQTSGDHITGCAKMQESCTLPPKGFFASIVTKVTMAAVLFGVVWSITEKECLPGGNLFGILVLFICAVCGGKLVGLIKLPTLPPFPPLLGMLLTGILLRNIPVVTDAVHIDVRWSAALRNIALAIILTRAGLGLNAAALRKLKAVCLRVAVGPCTIEACTVALLSHLMMDLPWIWSFILGFVLSAVSPAVVVPSMLLLQKDGYGVEKGIPTLLMAAGSFDDILAITGFTTCLGMAFATGTTWYNLGKGVLEVVGGMAAGAFLGIFMRYFPSKDQENLVMKRCGLLMGLSIFTVFGSRVAGLSGAGGLCTLVMAFIAVLAWGESKAPVAAILGIAWNIFQPLLFGLIGAEITVSKLDRSTVWRGLATLSVGLVVRVLFTYGMVLFAGFNIKEKVFVAVAWLPKATVQAAIGSTALDMARSKGDPVLEKYGMNVLTVAVLAILVTAPIGALGIGLAGPRLLQKYEDPTLGNAQTEGRPEVVLQSGPDPVAEPSMTHESSI